MPRPSRPGSALAAGAVAALLLVGACSDDGGSTAESPTTSTTSVATSTTAAGGATTSTTGNAAGCAATAGAAVPTGTASRAMGDLDGDGRADTLYVGVGDGGDRRFGVVTASGAQSEWTVPNASPVVPSILGVADADGDGHPEVFVNPGRVAYVLTLSGCRLQPYRNKDGEPYAFSVGFDAIGTGVGCVDADGDGTLDLVGLSAGPEVQGKVPWTRTIVTLHGTEARNGATSSGTYTSPADDVQIELLHDVTCGQDQFADPLVAPG